MPEETFRAVEKTHAHWWARERKKNRPPSWPPEAGLGRGPWHGDAGYLENWPRAGDPAGAGLHQRDLS